MSKRFLIALLSITVVTAAVLAGPAGSQTPQPVYKKLPTSGVKVKQKLGYYVECRYSGLGEVCEYVYAKRTPKGSTKAKLQRVKVKESTLKKKLGYYVECRYSGLGEVCEYVYATVKPKP